LAAPKTFALVILIAQTSLQLVVPSDDPPRGQIVDKVVCQADQSQSYALYLPSRHDAASAWPIVFCFDPGARGRLPVDLFREAAEKYGYILAGSNNSRNGAGGQGPESMRAMWHDAQARFAIDPDRVFAAGMSGGARLVCGFAQGGGLAGVIAFAAGFPGARAPRWVPFLFFGAAGVDDFNFPEMRQLDGELEKLGATKKIVTFEGGHGWPPVAVCTQAIEWLELQSMKTGKRPRDDGLIEALFGKAAASYRAAEASKNAGEAYLEATAVVRDFSGLRDISTFEKRSAQLGASKEVRKYLRDEREMQNLQYQRQAELVARWRRPAENEDPSGTLTTFRSLLLDLKGQSEAKSDSSRRRVARRVLNGCYIQAYEESRSLLEQKNYEASAGMLEMALSIFPDRPATLYLLSSTYAKAGDRKKALDALRKAAAHGFRDAAAVDKDESFESLRNDPRLNQILEEIRKK
jgi:dienelactone hydrolase